MSSSHKLKNCNTKEINSIVKIINNYSQFYNKEDINNFINNAVDCKTTEVINKYNIYDCIDIIISNGNILDAINKNEDNNLDFNDDIKFHQQLAKPYIRELIFNIIIKKINC